MSTTCICKLALVCNSFQFHPVRSLTLTWKIVFFIALEFDWVFRFKLKLVWVELTHQNPNDDLIDGRPVTDDASLDLSVAVGDVDDLSRSQFRRRNILESGTDYFGFGKFDNFSGSFESDAVSTTSFGCSVSVLVSFHCLI
jgi:hypothetical protein